MDFTAHQRDPRAKGNAVRRFALAAAGLTVGITLGLMGFAMAGAETTLTLDLKGVTPSGVFAWHSLPMTGRFEVAVDGVTVGRITANPGQTQLSQGETDTLTLPDSDDGLAVLTPVSEDFAGGFVCEGPISLTVTRGEANQKTLFAYARRGFFRLKNTAPDGTALPGAEFVVLNAQGEIALSLTADEQGAYTPAQALSNGAYQLVQMRAPAGSLLMMQPIPFTVGTYFGDETTIPEVLCVNEPAPLHNAETGEIRLQVGHFAGLAPQCTATLLIDGLCAGENDLPLRDYTVTVGSAALQRQDGSASLAPQGLEVAQITVNRPDGLGCNIQPLDAEGHAVGEPQACVSGTPLTLTGAVSAAIQYGDAQGNATVPEAFTAGTVSVTLRYTPAAGTGDELPARASVPVAVSYTYAYPAEDGISTVTAASRVAPAMALFTLPDGTLTLSAKATAEIQADGSSAIRFAPLAETLAEPLPVAAELPEGVRIRPDALAAGLTLVRTETADTVVFDTALWAAGTVLLPLQSGEAQAVTLWVLDPQSLPGTESAPEGYSVRAEAHEPKPLLDAVLAQQNRRYARLNVALATAASAGETPLALTQLLSGTVSEAEGQPGAGCAVLVQTQQETLLYGAVTDATGAFAVYGPDAATVGTVRTALPENAVSMDTGARGVDERTQVTMPAQGYAVIYRVLSGVQGLITTEAGRPIGGVSIALQNAGGTVAQTVTDAAGAYTLREIAADTYTVALTWPAGMRAAVTTPDGFAKQADGSALHAGLTIAQGQSVELNVTAAWLATVQGRVSEGDAPLSGLTATLTDAQGRAASMQTDVGGAYAFTALPAGAYVLTVTLPQGRILASGGEAGTVQEGVYQATYTLGEGDMRADTLTLEATGGLAGQIGEPREGEPIAIASVVLQRSATTDAEGRFAVEGLPAGEYSVYVPRPDDQTLLDGSAWQISESGDMIWITVTVAPGSVCDLPPVVYVAMTAIRGAAFLDSDGDGAKSDGESLMSGVPVALQRRESGAWVDATDMATDAYGQYAFENLSAGEYRVVSQATDGLAVSAVGQAAVSLGEPALGVVAGEGIRLANGDIAAGKSDVALAQPAQLTVAAFFDSNENGTRGEYERAVPGVTVEAVPAAAPEGEAMRQATTVATGEATLSDLPAGTYVLRITLPDGYQYTAQAEGWRLGVSCVGQTEGLVAISQPITLAGGQQAEAGVAAIPVGSFAGAVWNDLNNNGILDTGEPGVAGVTLTLTGEKTGGKLEMVTDDTGRYRFASLRNDVYNFTAEVPQGMLFARYTQTGGDKRSVFTTDAARATRQFIVADAQAVQDKNVGVIRVAALEGIAFLDTNYNGLKDAGEPPYAGVTLEVIKNSNEKSMGKTVTGEDGRYAFPTLREGDYRLRAILPNDGSLFTAVAQGEQGAANLFAAREGRRENSIPSVQLQNGSTLETCVGVAMGATLKGTVSLDAKYDGVRSRTDKTLSGVKVQLTDGAGAVVASDTTNANGRYTLAGIMPGTYTVRFQRKEGYAFTRYRPLEENGNRVQKLARDGFGETEPIAIAMGQTIEGVDAGMLPSSTLTGIFFDDLNDNGLRDEGEGGYTDGQVRLLSEDGELDLTETVHETGEYFFDGVMPGEYTLTYLLPEHATLAKVAEGGNTLFAQGRETVQTGLQVEAGKAYEAPMIGAVTLGSFAGFAYHDVNANGVRDTGEDTLPGVTVALQPKAGGESASAVTAADGAYALDDLRPGVYTLYLMLPQGYIFSADLSQSGLTLPAAQEATLECRWPALVNRAQNAIGAVKPASIDASVWLDENRDGTHAQTERLLSGLSYELVDESDASVGFVARAGEDGRVRFDNVRPGTYTLRFTLPSQAQPAEDTGDFSAQNGRMALTGLTVTEGETRAGITGGLVTYTSIGGTVTLEENEKRTPQADVTVQLFAGEGGEALKTVQTDSAGAYRFDGLWPGDYRIAVARPAGMIFVRPEDDNYAAGASAVIRSEALVGYSDTLGLLMGAHQLQTDVILIKPARVGDQAWLDRNQNGLVDADEPTLNGITVQLMSGDAVAYTTVTDDWGYYELADVYPGEYTLVARAYPELQITQPVPALRMLSSCLTEGDGTSATSDPFRVESGTRNFDFDLGYILPDGLPMPTGIKTGSGQNWIFEPTQTR